MSKRASVRRLALCLGGLFSILLCSRAAAAPADVSVPAPLEPWKAWVMKGHEYQACPFLATTNADQPQDYLCAWPGVLSIEASKAGASFTQHWRVDAEAWVPLPGDDHDWPLDVTVNGQAAVVLHGSADGESPVLRLPPGTYTIAGRFLWDRRPESLKLPGIDGLVRLAVDGEKIAAPERDEDDLTLGRGGAGERESFDLRVFRKLSDGIPAMLDTDLQFDVGGLDREVVLGPVLPEDMLPVSVTGDLAARLDADGRLHVQVKSGSWELHILARAAKSLASVSGVTAPAPWPTQEIWSYEADPRLRLASVHGPAPIDPKQAGVPDDWQSLPAFIMTPRNPFSLTENSRGLPGTEGNRLVLMREARLDFDGASYSYTDSITGTLRRDWRLDVPAAYQLQHAEEDSDRQEVQHLLITQGADGSAGVEVRNPKLDLDAGLRLPEASGALPVAGWQQPFDTVITELHLPYGYLLVGAPGADGVEGSWAASWTLLDVFVVAVLAVLAFRLLGRAGGLLALVYLVLGHHEPGAPLWILAWVLGFELACHWLPEGALKRASGWCGRIALVLLVLLSLPFVASQVRWAVYPQLQPAYEWGTEHARGIPTQMAAPMNMEVAPASAPATNRRLSDVKRTDIETAQPVSTPSNSPLGKIEVTGTRIQTGDLMQRYADNTVIQAGEGEPSWKLGSRYKLSWDGPVVVGQTARLLIARPWMTRLLRLILVVSLALLIAALVDRKLRGGSPWRLPGLPFRGAGTLAPLFLLIALSPRAGHADGFPPEAMLKDLGSRLAAAPVCAPQCASIARADVSASGDSIDIRLVVDAAARVAVPIPSLAKGLAPERIDVDGVAADGLVQRDKGLFITVPRGVHLVTVSYRAPNQGKYSLDFGLAPGYVAFQGQGWQADGINEHVLQTGSLGLTRLQGPATAARASAASTQGQAFPPFVILQRRLSLNLDWEVINQVQRVAPTEGGFSVDLPLLPEEHVTSSRVTVHGDHVTVPVPNGDPDALWRSSLSRGDTITLTAPAMSNHAEVWHVAVSPTWHAEFSGVPGVEPRNLENDDYWVYEFHPLPGERLTIKVTRPVALPGPTLAIDSAALATEVGNRASNTSLELRLRSTQAGDHAIKIPTDAEIISISKGGVPINVPLHDGTLTLPISIDGQSFDIEWRQPRGAGLVTRMPEADLGTPAADSELSLHLPADRWVLFSYGPAVGPAVLYWGELLVMLLVAWGLSRLAKTPLKFHHWLLLGLGFSTFSWPALLTVVAWILAMQWRMDMQLDLQPKYFRALQLGLVLLTVIAMGSIISSIPYGLLGIPDMHITGNGSSATLLRWFSDRTPGPLPGAWVLSLPMWCYKLAMLAWALWLAGALVGWGRWAFNAWTHNGYWPAKQTPPASP